MTIGTSDGVAPNITNITIAGIDDELNGTGPAGGTLQIPTAGFNLDLAYSDNSAIATGQTVITANVAIALLSSMSISASAVNDCPADCTIKPLTSHDKKCEPRGDAGIVRVSASSSAFSTASWKRGLYSD